MERIEKLVAAFEKSPQNVRFVDLCRVCEYYFGNPRQKGTSYRVYKTPWQGNPRVNIQEGKSGKAKAYQVRQVLEAIEKIHSPKTNNDKDV
jgi:hypothetical protein